MALLITCNHCGFKFEVEDSTLGQTIPCGACGLGLPLPANIDEPEPVKHSPEDELALMPLEASALKLKPEQQAPASAPPAPTPQFAAAAAQSSSNRGIQNSAPARLPTQTRRPWNTRYLYLSIALLPLALSVFHSRKDDEFKDRLEATIEDCSKERQEKLGKIIESETATLDDLLNELPGKRLKGALLSRNSWGHWLFALLSAAAFLALIVVAFPSEKTPPESLIKIGLFTGTIGIILLFALQYAAMFSQGVWLRGGGIVTLIFYIVKFIGFSYSAALDPENGFALSFLGFTCGVGFAEELCKALPIIQHFRSKATLDWRGACVMGLASGAGFGVSEGISYASHYYNGISGGNIYVIRFVSCVALHCIWSAAAGIVVWKRQFSIQGNMGFLDMLLPLIVILGVPMVLHGLYDTLLKQEMQGLALLTAFASMAWLAWQIEQAKRIQNHPDYQMTTPPSLRI